MRKQLFAAMVVLAATPGFAPGEDGLSPLPASFSASAILPVSASQTGPPPTLVGADSATRTGGVDSKPGPDSGASWWTPADCACAPPRCFWLSGEYLLWWIKDSQVPVLVTTGTPGASALPGVLGQPDTRVLFGGSDVENEPRSGGRFSGGFWLNDCQTCGIEASYFFLGSRSASFDDSSNGAPGSALIARPFFDVLTGLQNAELVAFPGIASGQIQVSSFSRLQGAELNLLCIPCCTPCCDSCDDQACGSGETAKHATYHNTCCGCNYYVSLLGGFRYLQLDEGLGINESSQVNPDLAAGSPLFGGSTINIGDQFDTHNYFYGGQIGAKAELCWGRFFVDVVGKVALGATHEVVDINGATAITSPSGTTVVTPAGLLASGSNSGQFSRDRFAVVPELGINLGYQITSHLRATLGYSFLYWSSVVRPGDQVDVGLSGTQIPTDTRYNPQAGPVRPEVLLRDTDFWAQGLNVGLEFRF